MNKLTFYLLLALVAISAKVFAQETFETKVKSIARSIASISKKEKENLKNELRTLDEKLNNKEISKENYETEKKVIATKYATVISEKITLEEEKLRKLVKENAENSVVEIERDTILKISNKLFYITDVKKDSVKKSKSYYEKRNTSSLVFAMGINNALADGQSIDNSPFKTWESHFYEIGYTRNYRLIKDKHLLKLRYGFSFVYNNLRPENNQYFEVNGNQTNLVTSALELEDSRFRTVQLNFPLYLEFDFSPSILSDTSNKKLFKSKGGFKLGIGGYIGANISARQYLEYRENGIRNENMQRADFNTHDLAYGVGAYIGYDCWSLYAKYDLNTVFLNNTQNINNISFGIRIN